VLRDAAEEEHTRVDEVAAEFGLRVPHRPLEEDVRKPRAGRERRARDGRFQLGDPLAVAAGVAEPVARLHQAEADRVGRAVPAVQQLAGTRQAAVGAEAVHMQGLAEEAGAKLEVLALRTEADADHVSHGGQEAKSRALRSWRHSMHAGLIGDMARSISTAGVAPAA
jgi:hypothetical protein